MCHALTFGFLGFWIEYPSKSTNQQVFVLYMMQNNHSDMPLLKLLKSVYQIKSYVEKSELVHFF